MGETETGEGVVERAEPVPGPPAEEPVLWSPEVEVCLFHAMLGHKPVGVNRHFHMICIRDKFSQNIGRQISSKVIWEHLRTMYDMQALHESEILPFPNSEKNFILPEEIIQEVKEDLEKTTLKSYANEVIGALGTELQPSEHHSICSGKVATEEDIKEETKEDVDLHSASDETFTNTSTTSGKTADKPSKEKERTLSESGSKESGDKRKRSRLTEKVVNANSNPSSPNANKRRRT